MRVEQLPGPGDDQLVGLLDGAHQSQLAPAPEEIQRVDLIEFDTRCQSLLRAIVGNQRLGPRPQGFDVSRIGNKKLPGQGQGVPVVMGTNVQLEQRVTGAARVIGLGIEVALKEVDRFGYLTIAFFGNFKARHSVIEQDLGIGRVGMVACDIVVEQRNCRRIVLQLESLDRRVAQPGNFGFLSQIAPVKQRCDATGQDQERGEEDEQSLNGLGSDVHESIGPVSFGCVR